MNRDPSSPPVGSAGSEDEPSPVPWRWLDWSLILLLARIALAGVFWLSGQTKIEGLQIDLVQGRFELGWPQLAEGAVALFRDEYRLPLLAPELAATLAALGEHLLPLLLLLGLGTRLAASGLLAMTLVIQLLVYPGAWPTHGTWAAGLLVLMRLGAGRYSLDFLLGRWLAPRAAAGGWPRWLRAATA